ncbi:PepSY domain-containing protein [Rhodoblastus acidophilus]|uniref:PepSY domain-containing protein n=1 Tax=Candidatus Rhodoblastus alkanivorans TaxID=2954117 RepID=A0ABS9Z356_9HYPH|nr:PepSY domain-containing protein [Candidatus Rhodoblastus alkanivorans]MCI4677369.1 PepSY domain-containing protein [Candidatus Rhodoblastus alkanivorans]MCI4682104.1 PepSY domain-containing protein [Candidatus Rhodoblastus alkanivorans]MDI4639406.1 PepSY domain-containing protein [Rhodoblastus acidophilus]
MNLTSKRLGLIGGIAVLLTLAPPAFAFTGQKLAGEAKVGIREARAIALKAHPGAITDEELERERGGSGLRYSFDIRRGAVTQEVGVDARTGKVLENDREGPHPD